MHFHGFFTLARAAGSKPEVARIIAHASQFVEDALNKSTQLLREHEIVHVITGLGFEQSYTGCTRSRQRANNIVLPVVRRT
jgi:hypothetical protein